MVSFHSGFLGSSARNDPPHAKETPLEITNDSAAALNSESESTQVSAEKGFDLSLDGSYWDACMPTEVNGFATLGDPNGLDAFSGFDIPFWFDQEQHWGFQN